LSITALSRGAVFAAAITAKICEDVFWEWEQRKDRFWVQLANQGIKL